MGFGMTHRSGFSKISYLGVLAGLLGYFFHETMLSGGSAVPLIAFSVLVALLFWLVAASLERRAEYQAVFRPLRRDLLLSLVGSLALGAGCVLRFSASSQIGKLISVLGLVGAGCLIVAAVFRMRGTAPAGILYVPAALYYVCRLFSDFRRWTIDPAILDYCFSLFALIFFMLAIYHTGAFSFDHGARRRLCFYSLGGVYFGAVSMAGQSLPAMLIYGAGACLCLSSTIQTLGDGK